MGPLAMSSTKLKLCAALLCILAVLVLAACQSNESSTSSEPGAPSLDPAMQRMRDVCLNSAALTMIGVPEGAEDEFCDCAVQVVVEKYGGEGDVPVSALVDALMECAAEIGD